MNPSATTESPRAGDPPSFRRLIRFWRRFGIPPGAGDFSLSPRGQLLLFVAAWLVATLLYALVITLCYRALDRDYLKANVIGDLFRADPGTNWEGSADGERWLPEAKTPEGRKRMLFRSLQLAGLVKEEETVEKNSIPKGAAKVLFDDFAAKDQESSYLSREGSTLRMVIRWAQLVPQAQRAWTIEGTPLSDEDGFREWNAQRLAAILAQQPGVLPEFRRLVSSKRGKDAPPITDSVKALELKSGQNFGVILFHPFDRRAYLSESAAGAAELLNLIYAQTGLTERYGSLAETPKPAEVAETQESQFTKEDFRFLSDSSSELLSRVHANGDVRSKRYYLAMFLGPEQYAMTVLFFWMLFLMAGRQRRRVVGEEGPTRRLLGFVARAFPDGVPEDENRRLAIVNAACIYLRLNARDRADWLRRTLDNHPRRPERSALVQPVAPERLTKSEGESAGDSAKRQRDYEAALAQYKADRQVYNNLATEYNERLRAFRNQYSEWIQSLITQYHELRNRPTGYSLASEFIETVRRELEFRRRQATPATLRALCDQAANSAFRSRWLIRWVAKSLPAVGFIGTVRGMLLALGSADSIVRATTQATRAAAITDVAGQLGIAFTTTFVALVMGLITSYINDRQASTEAELIDDLDRGLTPLLDPAAGVVLDESELANGGT